MKEKSKIDFEVLREEAENSEGQESYRVLQRGSDYRIGVGVRLATCGHPSFFIEVLVYLCSDDSVDLAFLERKLMFLRELQKRGYVLSCQDGNCISCETMVSKGTLAEECEGVRRMIEATLEIAGRR